MLTQRYDDAGIRHTHMVQLSYLPRGYFSAHFLFPPDRECSLCFSKA